ncbi:MAG: PaaI family thioesterase [Chloroflexi bacterium]|nr:PaaI family thioesterase [Chloroflexota bacterium]MCH7953427.1 PaaI family thioesterase [Chloroflexota bacterium]MCI0782758.1 PaaI family thioesterase [Chloroflexota bacterium]MCI0814093.1 PaaI family thioesterase [Chloroflexota bacterium]MCI0816739.1 PaaI family thioesterase [Chloroflexota bacterium]
MTQAIGQPNIDVLRAAARGEAPMPPAAKLLGWKPLSLKPGHVRVQYTARPEWYNPQGSVQGGFIAAMLDDAMGPAAFTSLEPGQFAPTLELKVNFYRPVSAGTVIAEGRVVHRTRRILFLEGRLFGEDGELAAGATATARVGQMTPTDGS